MSEMNSWPPRKPERNPLEVWLFLWVAVGTGPLAFGLADLPMSLQLAPESYGRATCLLLFLGGILGFISLAWRDRYAGLRMEQIAVLMFGLGSVLYASAVVVALALPDVVAADILEQFKRAPIAISMSYGAGFGCGWRFAQIGRYMNRRRDYLAQQQQEATAAAGIVDDTASGL